MGFLVSAVAKHEADMPRNAVPDRAPGMIEGHQGLISPILTLNTEESVNYGIICSIYPVCFAGSGATVALLTRDNGPSATETFTRSATEPKLTPSPHPRPPRARPAHFAAETMH